MMGIMAKKIDIDKKNLIKMLSPETFNIDVKNLADKMPLMDAILHYCEQNKLEYETAASLISTDLKRVLRKEAEDLKRQQMFEKLKHSWDNIWLPKLQDGKTKVELERDKRYESKWVWYHTLLVIELAIADILLLYIAIIL